MPRAPAYWDLGRDDVNTMEAWCVLASGRMTRLLYSFYVNFVPLDKIHNIMHSYLSTAYGLIVLTMYSGILMRSFHEPWDEPWDTGKSQPGEIPESSTSAYSDRGFSAGGVCVDWL